MDTEYLYKTGKMPKFAYYQLNDKSAMENYIEQKNNMHGYYVDAEYLAEMKRKIEDSMLEAIMFTLSEGAGAVVDAAATDMINTIDAAFGNGTGTTKQLGSKTFSAQLGAMLGQALVKAPFKMLDEIFNDQERRK